MDQKKPDFFIVGAAKSGTTSLYEYLKQHPEIYFPERKEPHFFGNMKPGGEHVNNESDYLKLFEDAPENTVIGEASTSYLYSSDAAYNIQKFNRDAKIIIMLRNPVDRAYSMYRHQVRNGAENLSFEEGLKAENERILNDWKYGFHYFAGGEYSWQIENYYKIFGQNNVKVFLFDDFKEFPNAILLDILNFLNVNGNVSISTEKVHNISNKPKNLKLNLLLNQRHPLKEILKKIIPKTHRKRIKKYLTSKNMSKNYDRMNEETRNYLVSEYRNEINNLERVLNRDLSMWRK
ncbi:sulfotransferase family protein [Alkalibacillus sp. S2W]|uniref:sulfotransferase family protein n=1 Tax=Alkalibacillus sp. S2W TaxID=3386553 RepID=UPI00398C9F8C